MKFEVKAEITIKLDEAQIHALVAAINELREREKKKNDTDSRAFGQ
jgi:hypothetical protein